MKRIVFFMCVWVLVTGCAVMPPAVFTYQPVQTPFFTLAAWQKDTDSVHPVKFYIEGDGAAFTRWGQPGKNPTPRGTLVRRMAYGDESPNVVYLARPCQYVSDPACRPRDWTTARFSERAVESTATAIRTLARGRPVILIGYSGGAQLAGLVAVLHPELDVRQLVTVAGNLDHRIWTREKGFVPLNESLSLTDYQKVYADIPQIHYIAQNDRVILPRWTYQFVQDAETIHLVPGASHDTGFTEIFPKIWALGR